MQITRATDYAVRVMVLLAGLPPGTRANRESLAAQADVPPQFMGKVLQSLARAQLILSHRGVQGGFTLARPGAEISMLDVVVAMEGPVRLNVCLVGEGGCDRAWWCAPHNVWVEAQEAMTAVLRAATLDRLARESNARLALGRLAG